jgi:glyoxylase-like metal-dependent hydrolase (beta-lactamase superfamily II)
VQITEHVYSTHIQENQNTFGAMHPGGTQIYFVGDPNDRMVMIDSGEPYRSWTRQILAYYEELGRPNMSAILISHGHGDHIGGLDRLQEVMDCPVRCHPKLAPRLQHILGGDSVEPLKASEVLTTGDGATLRPLFTPGHEEDHVCYFLRPDRVLFSGDNLLGNSSSSVRDLKLYMASLGRMAQTRPQVVCPGHGDTILRGEHRIQQQIAHRQGREDQVLAALTGGANTVGEIVSAVYPRNLRKNLREAAARNVRTHLAKLRQEQRVVEQEATYTLPSGEGSG